MESEFNSICEGCGGDGGGRGTKEGLDERKSVMVIKGVDEGGQ